MICEMWFSEEISAMDRSYLLYFWLLSTTILIYIITYRMYTCNYISIWDFFPLALSIFATGMDNDGRGGLAYTGMFSPPHERFSFPGNIQLMNSVRVGHPDLYDPLTWGEIGTGIWLLVTVDVDGILIVLPYLHRYIIIITAMTNPMRINLSPRQKFLFYSTFFKSPVFVFVFMFMFHVSWIITPS